MKIFIDTALETHKWPPYIFYITVFKSSGFNIYCKNYTATYFIFLSLEKLSHWFLMCR